MISASYSKKRTKHCGQDMITQLATKVTCDMNRLPIEHEGRTGEYWPSVVAVRTERSEVRSATTDRGPIFPSTPRASSVSKLFIIWHSASDSKMHFRWLALKGLPP